MLMAEELVVDCCRSLLGCCWSNLGYSGGTYEENE